MRLLLPLLASLVSGLAQDSDPTKPEPAPEKWNIHFQATSIGQMHGDFRSPYEGDNSLPPHLERRVSLTMTIFFAVRLGEHTVIVIDPEMAGGKGFGDVRGIAGFTNGEIPRVASATPTLYLARGYVRNTWALGPETESVEGDANQLAGRQPVKRITLFTGKLAATDFFDNNTYSHDPRTQFMNWSIMYNGAWDYPADTRGYTAGAVQELALRNWSVRAGTFLMSTTANGPTLDTRIAKNRGEAVEGERRYAPFGRAGAIRLLGFLNRYDGGGFRDALRAADGSTPDLASVRRNGARKYGFGINLEQALARDTGVFARYGWADGQAENFEFTQIDRSLSGGLSVGGWRWRRKEDRLGIAAVRNYLSGDQRAYLAAGGLGFIIGDGRLSYRPEAIVEAYYAWRALPSFTVTLDYQHVQNPAYNRDRGPVSIGTVRLHWEK